MKNIFSKKIEIIIFASILFVSILLRLQNFHSLPIDAHPMRQTDTESVAYNFAFTNHNILFPQNSLIRPQTNTHSYFFLEFPLYEYGIGILYMIFGWHLELARIYNIVLFSTGLVCLYYFAKNYFDKSIALLTIFLFSFTPASIFFFGHAIHTDVFAVVTLLYSLAAYIKWNKSRNNLFFSIALFFLSLSVATRPFIALVLPAYLYLLWIYKAKKWEYYATFFGSFLFYGTWYAWTKHFTSMANYDWENWVLTGREQFFDSQIFINHLLLKNVVGEVMGKLISVLSVLGIIIVFVKKQKKLFFIPIWMFGIPAYWLLVPSGNITHQYYANVYMIPVILGAAVGLKWLFDTVYKKIPILAWIVLSVLIISIAYNGYRTSGYFYAVQVSVQDQHIAQDIEKVIPRNKKLVYLQWNNSVPFSLVHRKGWILGLEPVDVPTDPNEILKMKKYGAEYIVASKNNTNLSVDGIEKIKQNTKLIYSSEWDDIYSF